MADELGLEEQEGVVMLQVRPGLAGGAHRLPGGRRGPQVGRSKIETVSGLEDALKERQRAWPVVLKRGSQTVRLQLSG